MKSLRLRLVAFTLAAVALAWLATALVVWREAHHELDELFDKLPAAAQSALAHEREEIVGEIAEHLMKPLLVALPALAVALALAVSLALRPLRRLADEVGARAPEHLQPLRAEAVPGEVRPLIARLNDLFAAIERALENERRFTADAAHELRTPLAALKAQAQVALAATQDDERQHALQQIVLGCDRATHLVEQLLTLARLDAPRAGAFAVLDLRTLAAEVLAEAAEAALRRNGNLALLDGPTLQVRGDATLLRVLLRNLVDNALRHSPAGRTVEVAIGTAPPSLSVSDDGPGLDAAARAAVVQRFHRAAGAGEGSGLGLSIVSRIAQLHGAQFALETAPNGRGTVARLRFAATPD